MHDWVVSTKNDLEKFKMEFEDHFDMHYSLIYYVYTFFALMVDQRAKNMFLTYWGKTGKWYPYFYDNDTSFGINNEGQLVLDYYHEDTDTIGNANVYNGQNSVLWTNFRQAFADEIKETYQQLRNDGLITYDKLVDRFITNGSDKWSESIYNEDMDFKYISMLRSDDDATNLPQVRGTGEEHFRYFVENRLNYCDSKWYASDYANDYISLRIYTPTTWAGVEPSSAITVTPFSNMYAGVRYKANGTLYQQRATHGVPVTFRPQGETFETENNETFNDTETAIYGAHQLSSIGDLAPLYCGSVNVANADKLIELKVGDATEGYSNTNLHELSVGTNKLLKRIDVRNCPNFASVLALANCPSIEEVYATGSSITGVEFPVAGFLKKAYLPGTLANFTLKDQLYVEELTFEGYNSIKTITIENCPTIDYMGIVANATNLERLRLTDVNLSYDTCAEMFALAERNLAGIDENGTNIAKMWVDGTCHIGTLTGAEYARIKSLYPYLEITYDVLTAQLVYMDHEGSVELLRQTIQNGGDGEYTGETPTKESTAQYDFTHAGWSLTPNGEPDPDALKRVEADRVVYAAYSSTIRNYTVNFYVDGEIKETYTIPYGGTATYAGKTPTSQYSYLQFVGWGPSPVGITGDTNCYAQWYDNREIADDWETIAQACLDGSATSKYAIGSYKNLEITYEDGTSEIIPMEVADHNHDELVDGTYKWERLSDIPGIYTLATAVIYNNEIHMVNYSTHKKYDGTSWIDVSIPQNVHGGCSISVWNNEIHTIGSSTSGGTKCHASWNGTEWVEYEISISPQDGRLVTFNNELYLAGAYNISKVYKFNGAEWIEVGTSPFNVWGKAFVLDDIMYIAGSDTLYEWDGSSFNKTDRFPATNQSVIFKYNGIYYTTKNGAIHSYVENEHAWVQVSKLPYTASNIIEYNNEIHAVGGKSFPLSTYHYKWSAPTYEYISGCAKPVLVYEENNLMYIVNANTMQTYDGTTLTKVNTLAPGNIDIYDAHIYGFRYAGENYCFDRNDGLWYKLVDLTWVDMGTLPITSYINVIEFNNELYCLKSYAKDYYKWDGTEWTSMGSQPSKHMNKTFFVFDNLLHMVDNVLDHYTYNGTEWTNIGSFSDIVGTATWSWKENNADCVVLSDRVCLFIDGGMAIWNGSEWSFQPIGGVTPTIGYYNSRNAVGFRNSIYRILDSKLYRISNPKATLTFIAKNLLKDDSKFSYDNYVGYVANSYIRPLCNNTVYPALPTTLQSAISEVIKISDYHRYDGTQYLVKSTEKVWIPSTEEVSEGGQGIDLILIKGQGEAYPIFTDSASRIRTKYGDISGKSYWLRSTRSYSQTHCVTSDGGVLGSCIKTDPRSILIGFCI